MQTANHSAYGKGAIALHWIVGIMVIGMLIAGNYMVELEKGTPQRAWFFNLHKSVGMVLIVLVFVRLWWRAKHSPPPLPETLPRWQQIASKASHHLLYACMVIMPLAGFIGTNFGKFGTQFFFVTEIPPLFGQNDAAKSFFYSVHHFVAEVFVVLIGIHILAALKHLIINKDGVFQRMLPGVGKTPPA
jgi:cytochrome b561